MYLLCGFFLFFPSQNPSFANAAIASDTHFISKRDVISSDEEDSSDGKFRSGAYAYAISNYLHPDTKKDSFHDFIDVFLKQLSMLYFSLRSPPIISS